MALMPKRVKYRKSQRGKIKGKASRNNFVAFGDYGLQSLEKGWITSKNIEASRVSATHFLHREGRVYIRIFPKKPVSAQPLETRMGKGKGETEAWVASVRPGTVMIEIGGVEEHIAKQALLRVAHKLPLRCRFVKRRHSI